MAHHRPCPVMCSLALLFDPVCLFFFFSSFFFPFPVWFRPDFNGVWFVCHLWWWFCSGSFFFFSFSLYQRSLRT
ncbi:hypothetical protein B0T22DRAFT_447356 [Podospora appendiculata]|uniref:Uncharacterized protein n=1 Tax=Podospora appendiculata TaxID=314037 RepID=A0AAE0XFF1_9PEZI|nr:hypothetical protein B0T22DRAFT_447356 [Podospora appendiculata]